MNTANDPRPGNKAVTNTEEQDVAVNHSTVQEGGYDEPVEQPQAEREEPKPAPAPEKERTATSHSYPRKDSTKRSDQE